MLVITRKKDESFIVDKDIEIIILENDGVRVKLGIKAPNGKSILRKELIEEVSNSNREAIAETNIDLVLSLVKGEKSNV